MPKHPQPCVERGIDLIHCNTCGFRDDDGTRTRQPRRVNQICNRRGRLRNTPSRSGHRRLLRTNARRAARPRQGDPDVVSRWRRTRGCARKRPEGSPSTARASPRPHQQQERPRPLSATLGRAVDKSSPGSPATPTQGASPEARRTLITDGPTRRHFENERTARNRRPQSSQSRREVHLPRHSRRNPGSSASSRSHCTAWPTSDRHQQKDHRHGCQRAFHGPKSRTVRLTPTQPSVSHSRKVVCILPIQGKHTITSKTPYIGPISDGRHGVGTPRTIILP